MSDSNGGNGSSPSEDLVWHRVLAEDQLPEGRVTTVHAGTKLDEAIQRGFDHQGRALIEVVADPELV